ncbi:glycerophosphodiester phosphodiesterase [Salinifilum ghardaiensis]
MTIRGRLAALVLAGTATLGLVHVPAAAAPATGSAAGAEGTAEVFGHRGASGYRPEHTLVSYALAARTGADYIEVDLVSTKDGVLVARHENEISGTTDVAEHPEFADRRTTKTIDGEEVTGWFTEDFTLAELKTLRAQERLPGLRPRNTVYDGQFEVPTFAEVLDLRERLSRELGREVGIAPETKHPSYFGSIGRPLEPGLVTALTRRGLNTPRAKVAVQSFEVGNLERLDEVLRTDLVQLVHHEGAPQDFVESGDPRSYRDMVTPEGLRDVAAYADWVSPSQQMILPTDEGGRLTGPTALVDDAHAAGLDVAPYTLRAENHYLPADFRSSDDPAEWGDVRGYGALLLEQGVDALFADQPDVADRIREGATAAAGA